MADVTGIGWTDATANFVIGCTKIGPGCEGCYAAVLALNRFGIMFEPGGRRHVTQSGFQDPPRWQRMHDRGAMTMIVKGQAVPVPRWVFACSLSDFFDNEWPLEVRAAAWGVIKSCRSLRWQIVTKRIGNASKMLPLDWNDGKGYEHVGIIATMVTQDEINRDMRKLLDLRSIYGVKWVGLSIEPQLGPIRLTPLGAPEFFPRVDWVIVGGESKQEGHAPRPFNLEWAMSLVGECRHHAVPVFVKQMGDAPFFAGHPIKFKGKGTSPESWPPELRFQQMPRIYDDAPARVLPKSIQPTLF